MAYGAVLTRSRGKEASKTTASDNITSMQDVAASTRALDGTMGRDCADMAALSRGAIGAAMASSQAAICGMQEITATLLAFLQSRAKDGLVASQQLAACGSPEALIEVQLECAKAMLQAYTDEFGRLHALTGKILADVLVPVQSRAVVGRKTRVETGADAPSPPSAFGRCGPHAALLAGSARARHGDRKGAWPGLPAGAREKRR